MTLTQALKSRIARQFSRAAADYDDAAQVQLDIAFDAVQLLPKRCGSLLDIGCGTGRVTGQLQTKAEVTFAMDLAQGMVHFASQHIGGDVQWLCGDAEHLPLRDECLDTVFSSMALQWCDGLSGSLAEIHRVLKPGGEAVLAVLAQDSMFELHDSWQAIDVNRHVNGFQSVEDMSRGAREAGFDVQTHQQDYVTWHPDVRSLLGSIKAIGANVVTQTGNHARLNKQSLSRLQRVYEEKFGQQGALPLTYKLGFLSLRKT